MDLALTGGRFAGWSPNPSMLLTGGTTTGSTSPAPPINRLHVMIGSLCIIYRSDESMMTNFCERRCAFLAPRLVRACLVRPTGL